MMAWRRLAGLLCLGGALWVVLQAGLPERADNTGLRRATGTVAAPEVGFLAPDFTLRTTTGEPVSLAESDAEITLIYFWSTTCAPCQRDMPALNDLSKRQPNLRILAVNMGEDGRQVAAWVTALDLRYDALLDPQLEAARRYQARGLPTSFLVNAGQRILRVFYGSVGVDDLQSEIARYSNPGRTR